MGGYAIAFFIGLLVGAIVTVLVIRNNPGLIDRMLKKILEEKEALEKELAELRERYRALIEKL